MQFHRLAADFFVPDGAAPEAALAPGGEVILAVAGEVLRREFPELAERTRFHVPDENAKRHGQAIAAASLPAIPKQENHAIP